MKEQERESTVPLKWTVAFLWIEEGNKQEKREGVPSVTSEEGKQMFVVFPS